MIVLWENVVLVVGIALLQIFPHELGHVLIARRQGVRVLKVEFFTGYALRQGALGLTHLDEDHDDPAYPHRVRVQVAYDLGWFVALAVLLVVFAPSFVG